MPLLLPVFRLRTKNVRVFNKTVKDPQIINKPPKTNSLKHVIHARSLQQLDTVIPPKIPSILYCFKTLSTAKPIRY